MTIVCESKLEDTKTPIQHSWQLKNGIAFPFSTFHSIMINNFISQIDDTIFFIRRWFVTMENLDIPHVDVWKLIDEEVKRWNKKSSNLILESLIVVLIPSNDVRFIRTIPPLFNSLRYITAHHHMSHSLLKNLCFPNENCKTFSESFQLFCLDEIYVSVSDHTHNCSK